MDAPVIARETLSKPHSGPCIIEEYDATCLVPPGGEASLDDYGNIVIEL
jgi:N-methylhydantoinase A